MDELLHWAAAHGAELSKLRRQQDRMLVTSTDVGAGEPCLELPGSLLLHAQATGGDAALSAHVAGALGELGALGASDVTLLVLRLALESALGAASFWAAYIAALSTAYPDPLWWCASHRAALCSTPLAAAVNEQAAALDELHSRCAALHGRTLPPAC